MYGWPYVCERRHLSVREEAKTTWDTALSKFFTIFARVICLFSGVLQYCIGYPPIFALDPYEDPSSPPSLTCYSTPISHERRQRRAAHRRKRKKREEIGWNIGKKAYWTDLYARYLTASVISPF